MGDAKYSLELELKNALERLEAQDIDAAIEAVETALRTDPTSSIAIHTLGLTAARMNENAKAKSLFLHAHDLTPNSYEHCEALAIVCARLSQINDALFFGKMAASGEKLTQSLDLLPAWLGDFEGTIKKIKQDSPFERARNLFERGEIDTALDAFQVATKEFPEEERCWRGLRDALILKKRFHEALLVAQALAHMPAYNHDDISEVAGILTELGCFDEARSCHAQVLSDKNSSVKSLIAYLADISIMSDTSTAEVDAAVAKLSDILGRSDPILLTSQAETNKALNEPASQDKEGGDDKGKLEALSNRNVVVGVLSGRFHDPRIYPALNLIASANAHLIIYNNGLLRPDDMPKCIADKTIIEIRRYDDDIAEKIIRRDDLDILIDLDGFARTGRYELVAKRPAKSCLGWYNTSLKGAAQNEFYLQNGVVHDYQGIGLARLPYNLQSKIDIFENEESNETHIVLGLLGGTKKITKSLVQRVAHLVAVEGNTKIVLSADLLGCTYALDEIESLFDEYGLLNHVSYVEPISGTNFSDVYARIASECDMLIDPGPDADIAAFEASIIEGCAYLGMCNEIEPNMQVLNYASSLNLQEHCIVHSEEELWARAELIVKNGVWSFVDTIHKIAANYTPSSSTLESIDQCFETIRQHSQI